MTLAKGNVKQWWECRSGAKILQMKKRYPPELSGSALIWKKELETIAAREGQSVARICEAFLLAGWDAYKKDGTRLLQRLIGRLSTKSLE